MELVGLQTPEYVDGNSLVHLLKHVNAKHDHPVFTAYQGHISIRTENHRLIRYSDGSTELYDRTEDPNEWKNLSHDPKYQSLRNTFASDLPQFKTLPYARGKNAKKK